MPTLPGTTSLHLFSTHVSGLRSNSTLPDLWLTVSVPSSVHLANFLCPNDLALILCCFIMSLILLLPYHICIYLSSPNCEMMEVGDHVSYFMYFGVFCSEYLSGLIQNQRILRSLIICSLNFGLCRLKGSILKSTVRQKFLQSTL